ncbi:phosphate ABC transporter ATP-binding protein PstB [Acerihabitans arboris]|uniref:Phosphate ABC transporter ATP-binding protein n=1 Tax=Acerihabitans arboris TaxID=2691583 RepID=A0A845SRW8_9GAMM|nr:phosphate ABC transporter ATP-binding protein PstB [Acerihabitans arboris]NDL65398.1 phosphate ABC transporter ATP-binding protein [Acerihabitans arboris]
MSLLTPDIFAQMPDVQRFTAEQTVLETERLNVAYGGRPVLEDISLRIPRQRITALIGPSGCGKSTLLRCFNRMNDLTDDCRIDGAVRLSGQDVNASGQDVVALRRRVGMVFQRPNPFPKSIYDNVVYGLRLLGIRDRRVLDDAAEQALRAAALWHEVKDRLKDNAFRLSNGQQQRLVIARAIAIEPEVLLLDEPTSALDPITTLTIEELMISLKAHFTLVLVTHNMQQAARVSDYTAFIHQGRLVEYAATDRLFTSPAQRKTEEYITGRLR